MKDMFEEIRPDKDFNLELLSYEEIFEGLKFGIAQAVSKYSNEEVGTEDLELNLDRCYTTKAYAEDMNLYPKIYLDMKGFYSVLLTPFEIELIETKYKIRTVSCVELRECFYDFMCEQFPNCNYRKIYEKYLINAEKFRKQREKHLFL